jgi:uncharacterized membrane protein
VDTLPPGLGSPAHPELAAACHGRAEDPDTVVHGNPGIGSRPQRTASDVLAERSGSGPSRPRLAGLPSEDANEAQLPGHLELPRPLRLLRTAAWSLTEAAGLPVAAYAVAAWMGGRDAGLLAALAAIWLTAGIRKAANGRVPSLLTISAVVLTLQTAAVIGTGELWIFLLQFPVANLCMCVLFARTARGPNPLVARLAAEVVALRLPATHHLGLHRFFQRATWLWAGIFLALTGSLAVLMATEPAGLFLMVSTVVTAALVVAGAGTSTLWFLSALRGLGLTIRFAAP